MITIGYLRRKLYIAGISGEKQLNIENLKKKTNSIRGYLRKKKLIIRNFSGKLFNIGNISVKTILTVWLSEKNPFNYRNSRKEKTVDNRLLKNKSSNIITGISRKDLIIGIFEEKISKLREFDGKKQLTIGNFLHKNPFNYGNLPRQTVE